MTLGQKAEINNQVRYVDILEKSSLGRETKKCKGPEARIFICIESWSGTLENKD